MWRRVRAAVVDDDESVRYALKRLLRAAELDAETYATGGELIKSLAHRLPDCAILDLHMPGMNGLDIQQQIATSGKYLPVIIITAHDEPATRARSMTFGAVAYLCMPLDDRTLIDAVQRAAARS
jgi:FixJ family two-component response regulator